MQPIEAKINKMLAIFTKYHSCAKGISWIFAPFSILFLHSAYAKICNPNGNLVIFSNYEGGTLTINCDENFPNLKIGIVTYNSPVEILWVLS